MTMEDIRVEGKAGRLRNQITAVVVDTPQSKGYRLPTQHEVEIAEIDESSVDRIFQQLPTGHLEAMLPLSRLEGNSGFRVILYGIDSWRRLVLGRQYAMLGTFSVLAREARDTCRQCGYDALWSEAVNAYIEHLRRPSRGFVDDSLPLATRG